MSLGKASGLMLKAELEVPANSVLPPVAGRPAVLHSG